MKGHCFRQTTSLFICFVDWACCKSMFGEQLPLLSEFGPSRCRQRQAHPEKRPRVCPIPHFASDHQGASGMETLKT